MTSNFQETLFQETLIAGAAKLELKLTNDEVGKLTHFAELVLETNKTLNLTRIVTSEDMAIKHFLDSLTFLKVDLAAQLTCIDVGTGAGFPGIPLAITCPRWEFVLVDSVQKKLKFIEYACDELGLTNVRTVHRRAEDLGRDQEYRDKFDLVISRAVAHLPVLTELCLPLVKNNGNFIAAKGAEARDELEENTKALELLGGELQESIEFSLPQKAGERSLLVFKKKRSTPPKFPRRAGIPAQKPLL